ncbi:major pollen allergen Ole e 10-like [Rosa sericea]
MTMEVTRRPLALLTMGVALLSCFATRTESRNSVPQSDRVKVLENEEAAPTWCIAKPSADVEKLHHNIDFSRGQTGIDCRPIMPGGNCFDPDNAVSHASVAMNLFYKATGKNPWDCHFNGTGLIVHQNPSVGICHYQA